MRLLNVKTLKLREFFGADVPHYAILSHRWEEEEVTLQDLVSGKGTEMSGWKKVIGCCNLAMINRMEYVWIDSCCIDKTSSAELSEAINSMFRWYRDAEICYAYLSDVSGPLEVANNMDGFRFSKWFTRGWTLQELLAPDELIFCDMDWQKIGTKEDLRDTISGVTGISHLFNFEDASVAQKMSWASERETTRIEDQAYCLLGIFGVNMPPLYGEGRSAFFRLQLEIMRTSNDESLFAWEDFKSATSGGLLALSPAAFSSADDVISLDPPWIQRPVYSMTNKGLEITLELIKHYVPRFLVQRHLPKGGFWMAPLNCSREGNECSVLSVLLSYKEIDVINYRHLEYQRVECGMLLSCDKGQVNRQSLVGNNAEAIYIKQPQLYSGTRSYCYFRIDIRPLCTAGWRIEDQVLLSSELGRWGSEREEYRLHLKLSNSSGAVKFQKGRYSFLLRLSCLSKKANVDFVPVGLFGSSAIGALKTSIGSQDLAEFVKSETRRIQLDDLTLLQPIQASFWKEGEDGGRAIFAIEVDEIQSEWKRKFSLTYINCRKSFDRQLLNYR